MSQLVEKRCLGWAVLAAGGLVASLLAVGSAPAGAVEIKAGADSRAVPNLEAAFSACVGDSIDDAGFADIAGLGAEEAINCLAYYGITRGKTADSFDPYSNVTRSQMALFLYRAADAAGIDLTGGSGSADFGDIADKGAERQKAIEALARNDILPGRGDTAFMPDAEITRAEMAVALVGFLRHGASHLFRQFGAAKGALIIDSSDLDHFADARASVPVAVDTAIGYLYELGVTTGFSDATYRPHSPVSRRNMASFITRALAHTNVRPAGLSVQSERGALTVSIRGDDFRPVANEAVDAFYIGNDRVSRAFDSDRECRSVVTAIDGDTTDKGRCKIDNLDPATDADGNRQLAPLTAATIGEGITVWAWTGDIGDRVDDGTDLVEFVELPSRTAATMTTVTPAQAETPMARFGSAARFVAQLRYTDDRGTPSAADDVDEDTVVGVNGTHRAENRLTTSVFTGLATSVTVTGGTPTATGASGSLGLVSTGAAVKLRTDSKGRAAFSVTTTDPDPEAAGDLRTVVWVLTPHSNAPGATESGWAAFADQDPQITTVKATPVNGYAETPPAGSTAGNGVVVTVLDQYDRPMRNERVLLESDANIDANSDGDFDDPGDTHNSVLPSARHTASTGSVRIVYSHKGSVASVETITATVAGTDVSGEATIYWAARTDAVSSSAGNGSNRVVAGSVAGEEIVVDGDTDGLGTATTPTITPKLVRYDANDFFYLDLAGSANDDYVDIESFEAQLAAILDPDNQALAEDAVGKLKGVLEWDSYDHDDEDDSTLFTLTVTQAA